MSLIFSFQAILFSISTQLSSICRTLSGATNPSRVVLGTMRMKGYPAYTKALALIEPHNYIV